MYDTEHENGVLICSIHRTPISKGHGRFLCLKCQRNADAKTTKTQAYFKGDLAYYTGKTEMIHGGLFYEVLMAEGYMKGQIKYIKTPPAIHVKPSQVYKPDEEWMNAPLGTPKDTDSFNLDPD